MSTMAFGIYSSESGNAVRNNEEFIIEIGNSHIACVAAGSDSTITAFELYTFNKEETSDFKNLFSGVVAKSGLLKKTFKDTKLYINNEFALPVPASKFDEEIVTHYLNLVYGEDEGLMQQADNISTEPGLMNAYRHHREWLNVINDHFKAGSIQHSYTSIIRGVIAAASNSTIIKVQFYPAYFIAVVIKGGALQFIQSFIYESAEDVLYYLLSISQRLNESTPDLTIYVSGMIDLQSALHSQLLKFFENIVVEEVDKSKLAIDVSQYPSHYFTPFFTLA